MRPLPSLKARRSPDAGYILAAAAALVGTEIAQSLLENITELPGWPFTAVRLLVLLIVCAVLCRVRKPAVDGLTGAGSYSVYARCLAEGVPAERVCVFFLDVDELKRVNDTYGHETGDCMLQRLADSFAPLMGERDAIFRVGGDEFVLVMRELDEDAVPVFLTRWRAELERLNGEEVPALEVSCGWAVGHGCDFAALVRLADDEMYKAKNEKKSDAM